MAAKTAKTWKQLKEQLKEKRTGKKNRGVNSILEKGEVVVQRLAAEVTGKAQKYNKIGPREFVSFPFEELTLTNIKLACKSHFSSICDDITSEVCDVLVGVQGPS